MPETQLDSQPGAESCEPMPSGSGGEEQVDYPDVTDGKSDEVAGPKHQENTPSPPLEVPVVETTPVVEKPLVTVPEPEDLFNAVERTTRHEQFVEKDWLQEQYPAKAKAKAKAAAKTAATKANAVAKKAAAKAKAAAKKATAKAKAAAKKATAKAKAAALRKKKANASPQKNTDETEKQVGEGAEVAPDVPAPEAKKRRKANSKSKRAIHDDDDDDADASKDVTSKPKAPQDTEEKETFARRYRPATKQAGQRWDAIKAVFNEDVGPKFHRASSLED